MDSIIRELINADHEARKAVELVEQERSQARALMETQKEEIFQRYKDDVDLRLLAHKQEQKKQLSEMKTKKEEEYVKQLTSLQTNFQERKTSWIHDIVERCLKG